MNCNPDPTRQAQKMIFSSKVQTTNHPLLFFNENIVQQTTLQTHLRMFLDSKLNFSEHLKNFSQKTFKTIGLLCKLQTFLPRTPLITIYISFIRPYLDYDDMIYAALANAGSIRGFSREKLNQEIGLETLQQRRWYRKLCYFHKILKSQSLKYLYSIIPMHNMSYRKRQCNKIPTINVKHDFFKNTFFP